MNAANFKEKNKQSMAISEFSDIHAEAQSTFTYGFNLKFAKQKKRKCLPFFNALSTPKPVRFGS